MPKEVSAIIFNFSLATWHYLFFLSAMATVFATRDGWETIATMCVRRDFMENIAWNSVRVHHHNSYVMQPVDAFAV